MRIEFHSWAGIPTATATITDSGCCTAGLPWLALLIVVLAAPVIPVDKVLHKPRGPPLLRATFLRIPPTLCLCEADSNWTFLGK